MPLLTSTQQAATAAASIRRVRQDAYLHGWIAQHVDAQASFETRDFHQPVVCGGRVVCGAHSMPSNKQPSNRQPSKGERGGRGLQFS